MEAIDAIKMPSLPATDTAGIGGHPRGLTTLFFTEMWERFSYYGMRAILILYMTAAVAEGGLGFDTVKAGKIYGLYTSSVYLTTLGGGWLADRVFGARRAVLLGGIIIACGHFSMAFKSMPNFYGGLILIAAGTGLLKPNISTMVGSLYSAGDIRRDAGFSIFYMGINLGAFISPFVCGYLGQRVDWHYGFAAAGVGMVLGLIQYVLGGARLGDIGKRADKGPRADADTNKSKQSLTTDEKKRLAVIGVLFIFSALFWMAFEQAGSTLNLFADRLTRNEFFGWQFPSSWFQSVGSLFIIALAPVFSFMWLRLGKRQPSYLTKFALGLLFAGLGFLVVAYASTLTGAGRVSPMWLIAVYLLHTIGELSLSPVGLSTITKLSPARMVGAMMGVWFLATSLGNFTAGRVAGFFNSDSAGALLRLFGTVALTTLGAALVLAVLTPFIKRLVPEDFRR